MFTVLCDGQKTEHPQAFDHGDLQERGTGSNFVKFHLLFVEMRTHLSADVLLYERNAFTDFKAFK